jgi:organic hydroperoxide reductase OsmC/OhrA
MDKVHRYTIDLRWTGNTGTGTSGYRAYGRSHEISGAGGKQPIEGSADPLFRGDAARWNPEELLVAAIAACHQLWYLHVCAEAGVLVLAYEDTAEGVMPTKSDGSGGFERVVLRPRVTLAAGADVELARSLHEKAHGLCNIANSVNFAVTHEPEIRVSG